MKKFFRKETILQRLGPQWLIFLGFFSVILIGAFLLTTPQADIHGQWRDPLSALFTATSATCVTGLSVFDIGTELTLFGQLVVLTLIQLGGLGITTFGTFFLVLVGRRLSVQSEFALMDAYGVEEVNGLRSLLLWTIYFTFLIEGIGALLLWSCYIHLDANFSDPAAIGHAFYYAVFHSISAFCNAGFSLHHDNMIVFQQNPLFLWVINALIVCGGLGFLVLYNLISFKFWRRNLKTRGRITLHTKIVLTTTLFLIILGALSFLVQEWSNTLKELSIVNKITCGVFQSITPRTAGYNVVPMDQIREITRFTTTLLMMIGGSPGSAAGGIKTTTLVVLIMTMIAMCKNHRETVLFQRTIPYAIVREALVIFLLTVSLILTSYGILLWTEFPQQTNDASKLLFETVSAVATVGLSINHTETLSNGGRFVIIVCMFVGRLGPLAVALMIGNYDETQRIRYSEEEIVVG